jgi:lipoprotein-releasing system permease protein
VFHPLSVFVGLRYVRARAHKFFVSFITWTSLVGVCLGVAALIVILSIMNGMEGELRSKLLALTAHARVVTANTEPGTVESLDWAKAAQTVRGIEGVKGVAPYADLQVLAVRSPEMVPVTLRGIDPNVESQVSELTSSIKQGKLSNLVPGSNRAILGIIVADRLAVSVGDKITVLVPTVSADGTPTPKLRELTVAGMFEVGLQEHDATTMLADIDDVRSYGAAAPGAQGLRVSLNDPLAAGAVSAQMRAALPKTFEVINWTQDHANYFRAVRIEKTMMAVLLMFIVGVAVFNIIAMLVMVVTDKRTDIAILRTLGISQPKIMGVFLTQGLFIGWLGVALGVGLGVLVASYAPEIAAFLQRLFNAQILDSDVYYDTGIPSEIHGSNVLLISLAALTLTALATVYPAIRASRTSPADALRYD